MGIECRTSDLDVFRRAIGPLLRPSDRSRCSVGLRADRYDARMRHDCVGALALTTFEYGNSVEVSLDPLVDYYFMHMPLAAGFTARGRGRELAVGVDQLHVMSPTDPCKMSWDARFRLLHIRIDQAVVDAQRAALFPAAGTTALPESTSLATPRGASLRRYLEFLRAESAESDSTLASVGARQAEQMFFALFFAAMEPETGPARTGLAPYYVQRAEDFIMASLEEDIGLIDVVAASGVSVRTLYYGFRRRHGVGPMAWLKERRLERVHAELAAADPETVSVTEVALRWRFWHLGRFARNYQLRFGESPSQTLKRSNRPL
jgi:AraC-like DNA-binding protein